MPYPLSVGEKGLFARSGSFVLLPVFFFSYDFKQAYHRLGRIPKAIFDAT